jgi:hypothetical protein
VPLATGVLAVTMAALLAQTLYIGILAFLGHPLGSPNVGLVQTAGVGIYTGALALAAYPLARLGRRLTEKESPF